MENNQTPNPVGAFTFKTELEEALDSVEFYDLMQMYRMADPKDQTTVIERFNDVKRFIVQTIESLGEGEE